MTLVTEVRNGMAEGDLTRRTGPRRRRLDFHGELTIVTAADQYERLRPLLGAADLELGPSGVTDLDTAGLQLLLLARREADRLGRRLVFGKPSRAVRSVLAIAHLDADPDPNLDASLAGQATDDGCANRTVPAAASGRTGRPPCG